MRMLLSCVLWGLVIGTTLGGSSELDENAVERKARRPSYCDSIVYSNRGVITSPNYPYNYNNNMDCNARIIPQMSGPYNIKLYFCDFIVESSLVFSCPDSVSLSGSSPICGEKSGKTYQYGSSGGPFDVKFKSDWRTTKRGYKIAFCTDCYDFNAVKSLCHQRASRPTTPAYTYPSTYFYKRAFGFRNPFKRPTPGYPTSRNTAGVTQTYPFSYPVQFFKRAFGFRNPFKRPTPGYPTSRNTAGVTQTYPFSYPVRFFKRAFGFRNPFKRPTPGYPTSRNTAGVTQNYPFSYPDRFFKKITFRFRNPFNRPTPGYPTGGNTTGVTQNYPFSYPVRFFKRAFGFRNPFKRPTPGYQTSGNTAGVTQNYPFSYPVRFFKRAFGFRYPFKRPTPGYPTSRNTAGVTQAYPFSNPFTYSYK